MIIFAIIWIHFFARTSEAYSPNVCLDWEIGVLSCFSRVATTDPRAPFRGILLPKFILLFFPQNKNTTGNGGFARRLVFLGELIQPLPNLFGFHQNTNSDQITILADVWFHILSLFNFSQTGKLTILPDCWLDLEVGPPFVSAKMATANLRQNFYDHITNFPKLVNPIYSHLCTTTKNEKWPLHFSEPSSQNHYYLC